jgi:hypothetical protein
MTIHNPSTYPIRGIFYLIRHSTLWNQIAFGLLIMILATIASTVFLFVFVFPIQSTALSVYMASWIGWIVSFILTLFEIGTSVLVISSIFLSYYMDIIFDAVGRQETMRIDVTPIERNLSTRFSCIKSFLILIIFRVFLLILTSPLNLIPILCTILYIYINGYYYTWSLYCRYFDLLDLTFLQTDFIQSLLVSDESLQVQ